MVIPAYGPPIWTHLGPPYIPLGSGTSAGSGGVLVGGDISVATFPRVSLRVPYMKRVRGSPKGVIVLLLFYHKHTSPLGHPLRTPYVETSKSSPQVPPGIYEGLGGYC